MRTVGDWAGYLDDLFPRSWAEAWDNPGLQVGDPAAIVTKILVALDPTFDVIREGADSGAQMLVTHHPLIFEPVSSIDAGRPMGAAATEALKRDITVFACHTNADVASPGVSDGLADELNVSVEGVLMPTSAGAAVKLVVFVPPASSGRLIDAMSNAGAGIIGEYDVCSYRSSGTGTFRPSDDASPAEGKRGTVNEVSEDRLEVRVPRERIGSVISALEAAHPYETPAYDVYALEETGGPGLGLGRVGSLDIETTAGEFADECARRLGGRPSLIGDPAHVVRRVALCGGSGASLIRRALEADVDIFVTGDVKHHDGLEALSSGLAMIDAGHFATEWPFVPRLAQQLETAGADVAVSTLSTDPFGERR